MALRFRTLDFRTIDGSNNNLADPTLNQADTDFARVGPANFADGFNEMTPGPNPREISNIVVAQEDAGEDGPHLTGRQRRRAIRHDVCVGPVHRSRSGSAKVGHNHGYLDHGPGG